MYKRQANLRLTYVQGSAAYYLPMWEYTIDEGPAALGDGDDVDQTLHLSLIHI